MKHRNFGRMWLVLALACMLLCQPVAQVKAAESFQYNPAAAVAYAAEHWDTNDGTVCDQFVKNCLHAGGVTIRAGGVDEVKQALVDAGFGTLCKINVVPNDPAGHINSADNPGVKAGDVLFFYCNGCKKSIHTTLISGFDQEGNMQCYGHNPAWDLVDWMANFEHEADDGTMHSSFQFYAVKMDTSVKDHKHDFGIKDPTDLGANQVYEKAHPHRFYDQCKLCNAKYYLGWNATVRNCHICNPSPNGIPVLTAKLVEKNGAPAVALSWTAVEGVETYEIHRAKGNSSTYFKIGTTGSTSFTNASGEVGVTYRYKIVAGSVESNVVTVTWPGDLVLLPPVLEDIRESETDKPRLGWTAVEGAEKYQVYRKESTESEFVLFYETPYRTYTNDKVEPGKSYDYKVCAVFPGGTVGEFSNVVRLRYTKNYTVTFVVDGKVVDTQTVKHGQNATLPQIPAKDGYTKIPPKWDHSGKNITSDLTITAVYTKDPPDIKRIYGANRYTTAFLAADELKTRLGVEKFQNIVVACSTDFADALSGSYLANQKNAPILLVHPYYVDQVNAYIKENLAAGGTVYILGGPNAVPETVESGLTGLNVKRLQGRNRYITNLEILKEAGIGNQEILVCTGRDFADGLSVSAVNKPILLVHNALTAEQKEYLAGLSGRKFYIIGGTSAIPEAVESGLKAYGTTERLEGANRYETSVNIAREFFPNAKQAVLVYGRDFPDGLSGGPLGYALNGPVILTVKGRDTLAKDYVQEAGVQGGIVLGGPGLIADQVVRTIFSMDASMPVG